MVPALLKYGLSRRYPAKEEIPRTPDLKPHYDVVIIGGGGHGVSLAYHLAARHGITNVPIQEKIYLGTGNTARSTTVIRADQDGEYALHMFSDSASVHYLRGVLQDPAEEFGGAFI